MKMSRIIGNFKQISDSSARGFLMRSGCEILNQLNERRAGDVAKYMFIVLESLIKECSSEFTILKIDIITQFSKECSIFSLLTEYGQSFNQNFGYSSLMLNDFIEITL